MSLSEKECDESLDESDQMELIDDDDDENALLSDQDETFDDDLAVFMNDRRQKMGKRDLINDVPALLQKIEDIQLLDGEGKPLDWDETFDITSEYPLEILDENDDFNREALIYKQTLDNFERAVVKLEEAKIKYRRPVDYYAEMLKTDDHMQKLKNHLLSEKRRKEEKMQRLQNIQMRIYAKKIQRKVILERQKKKAEDKSIIKHWKATRKMGDSREFPKEFLEENNPKRRDILIKSRSSDLKPLKSIKRTAKDMRYGNAKRTGRKGDDSRKSSIRPKKKVLLEKRGSKTRGLNRRKKN